MNVRRWVTFKSDLPYDGIEDEHDFIQWPGKNVAEAVMEILGRLGCTGIENDVLDERGYEVTFSIGKRQFGARVTMIDNYVVCFSQYSFLDNIFEKLRPEYIDIIKRINAEMNSDGRFHHIRWFKDDESLTRTEGALSPIEE